MNYEKPLPCKDFSEYFIRNFTAGKRAFVQNTFQCLQMELQFKLQGYLAFFTVQQ